MDTQETSQETQARDYESEARSQGWKPKEEFDGDPGRWTDAETFVKRGEEILPIVRKQNEGLKKELERTRQEVAEIKAAAKEFRAYQEAQFKQKAEKLESEIANLRAQRREAISTGDGDRVDAIEEQIDSLKDQQREIKATAKEEKAAGVDPALQAWVDENKWYTESPRMAAFANAVGAELVQQKGLQGPDLLQAIREEVEKEFPHKFEKEKAAVRNPMAASGKDGGPATAKGGKSYRDLPEAEKKACDTFVKLGAMSRDEYVKAYFEDK